MLVNDLSLLSEVLVLLASIVFSLVFMPEFDLVGWCEDSLDVLLIVLSLHHGLAALPNSALKTGLEGVNEIAKLSVLF